MRFWKKTASVALIVGLAVTICSGQRKGKQEGVGDPELAKKIRRFSPTVLTPNTSRLSANDPQALNKIIEAGRLMDPLFLRQVWSGNEGLRKKLGADKSLVGRSITRPALKERKKSTRHPNIW